MSYSGHRGPVTEIAASPPVRTFVEHPSTDVRGFLGGFPTTALRKFGGPRDTLAMMAEIALGDHGERSSVVRQFTTWVTQDIWPKHYLGEIIAIRNVFVQPSPWRNGVPLFKYSNDSRHVEVIKTPRRQVEEIHQFGTTVVDCDEIATMAATMFLQIGREVEYIALGFAPKELTHVALRVREPKGNRWIWCDPVAGPKEREAAERAQEKLAWSLD